jgi:hypothetical protein
MWRVVTLLQHKIAINRWLESVRPKSTLGLMDGMAAGPAAPAWEKRNGL